MWNTITLSGFADEISPELSEQIRVLKKLDMAHVEMRGTDRTEILDKPFGEKNLPVLCSQMAQSILSGHRDPSMPEFKDAAEASEVAWEMLRDAGTHEMPVKGTDEELVQIRERRSQMTDGYGLLKKRHNH